jgi:hypothetical protein
MAYGKVSETFWHDDKIRALTDRGRLFMLYLCSCPHGNRFGLFVLDPLYAAADIQWTSNEVVDAIVELRDAGRIGWDSLNRVVFVRNFLRHNTLINSSVVKGALNDLSAVPNTPLLAELLAAVEDAQRGPIGPILSHYGELEAAVRARSAGIMASIMPPIMTPETQTPVDKGDSHNEGHNGGHNEGHNREGKVRGVTKTHSRIHSPNLDVTYPSPADPGGQSTDPDEAAREDGEHVDQEGHSEAWWMARANIVAIRGGTEQPVEIHGQTLGLGIDLAAYQRIVATGHATEEVVASAIAYLPEVTGLDAPMTLRLWEHDPAVLEQCLAKARTELGSGGPANGAKAKAMPHGKPSATIEARKAELRAQIEKQKAADAQGAP